MARHTRRFFGDMVDHLRGPGFFTMVAGTSVLASQFMVLTANYHRCHGAVGGRSCALGRAYLRYSPASSSRSASRPRPGHQRRLAARSRSPRNSIAVLSALLAAHIDQPARWR
jgi:hypothetical protein